MQNFKMIISYLGTNYNGFQIQPNKQTIQGEIEKCLFKIFKHEISIIGAGRTDSGVHAEGQVANFFCATNLSCNAIKSLMNNILPKDISIIEIIQVEKDFHSRFSAHKKTYHYNFYLSKTSLPLLSEQYLQVSYCVDMEKMQQACKLFVGRHNFKGFSSNGTIVNSTIREIYDCKICMQDKNKYCLEITANSFLYNMVRVIVGTLISVGRGKLTINDIKHTLESGEKIAAQTVKPNGLVLRHINY